MPVEIKTVRNRQDLKRFVDFPEWLYRDCDNWVPALRGDEFDTFDPKKNAVKVVLMPLKRFRNAVETRRPQNKVKPPRALMTEIRGESSETDQVKFGENIVVTGRNLTVVDMGNQLSVVMYDRSGRMQSDCWCINDMIEHTPTRIVVPFPRDFKRSDFGADDALRFEFCTDSGKPNGPIRHIRYKHKVKVLFD